MISEEVKQGFIKQAEKLNEMYSHIPSQGEIVTYKSDDGYDIECVYFKTRKKNAPLLIEVHGGGHVAGHARDDENMCVRLRKELKCNVFTINYRLSPKYPYPRPVYDVYQAILGVMKDTTKNFSREHVYFIGHSAGANLVTTATILINRNHDFKIKGLMCNYPEFDLNLDPICRPKFKDAIPVDVCRMFNELYIGDGKEAKNPLASPVYLKDEEAKLFPKTLFLLCGKDSLMIDGLTFNTLLTKNGVQTKLFVFQDAPHGYFEDAFKDNGWRPEGATEEQLKAMKEEQIRLSEITLKHIKEFFEESEKE